MAKRTGSQWQIFSNGKSCVMVKKTRDGGEAGVRTPVTANPVSRVSCHLQPESHAELAVHAVSLETRREGRNAKDDDTTLERCLN